MMTEILQPFLRGTFAVPGGLMSVFLRWQSLALLVSASAFGFVPQDCKDDHLCYTRVPGAVCADGKPTGFQYMYRKGAKNLIILLGGGGACWDHKTCSGGTAQNLSEQKVYEGDYFAQDAIDQKGWRDLKNPDNPIASNFNIVHIPYCTADIFTGDRVSDYGTKDEPFVVHHKGYNNTILMLDAIHARFPQSAQVVFYGMSAGGLGVTWHARNVAARFPHADVNIVNDGGLLFKSPFVDRLKMKGVFDAWGSEKNTPKGSSVKPYSTRVVEHLQKNHPKVKYGFISGYKDYIMSYFSRLLAAPNWTVAVRETMNSLADNEFTASSNYRVFYLNDWNHVYFIRDPASVKSDGVTFFEWANAMFGQSQMEWDDVRPTPVY